jgi:hypothetical protein
LNSGPWPWATPPALFCDGVFKIGSHELFAQTGLELWSSRSLPPEQLGLQGVSHWHLANLLLFNNEWLQVTETSPSSHWEKKEMCLLTLTGERVGWPQGSLHAGSQLLSQPSAFRLCFSTLASVLQIGLFSPVIMAWGLKWRVLYSPSSFLIQS